MKLFTPLVVAFFFLAATPIAQAQPVDAAEIAARIDKEGKVSLDQGRVLAHAYDYVADGEKIEALVLRPAIDGKQPAVVALPGYMRTARDYIPLCLRLAREGFACLAITPRGFGKSEGKADFVGPKTIASMETGFRKFRSEPYVDADRVGLYGYSRGGMAASLLAVRLSDKELKAAVFGAGVYDFKRAYDDVKLPGIRANMEAEAGLSEAALKERSSVFKMTALPCPVLILHGDQDQNVPVTQAYLLRDELVKLGKKHELKIFPGKEHALGMADLMGAVLPFFKRELMPSDKTPAVKN